MITQNINKFKINIKMSFIHFISGTKIKVGRRYLSNSLHVTNSR